MHIFRLVPTIVSALTLTIACARQPGPDGVDTALADPNTPVAVEVENHGWSDATIYLLSGGLTRRVGMVTGSSSQSFTVPSSYIGTMGEVRLQAHPIGSSGTMTTDLMTVQPGQIIRFTVENHLANSSYGVY
jgi:hypothetical protein